jgi:hypothetical protein
MLSRVSQLVDKDITLKIDSIKDKIKQDKLLITELRDEKEINDLAIAEHLQ